MASRAWLSSCPVWLHAAVHTEKGAVGEVPSCSTASTAGNLPSFENLLSSGVHCLLQKCRLCTPAGGRRWVAVLMWEVSIMFIFVALCLQCGDGALHGAQVHR